MSLIHREMVRFGFLQLRHTNKVRWAAAVSLVPFVIGLMQIIGEMNAHELVWRHQFSEMTSFMLLGASIPFVSLLLASGLFADEAEERTLSYLLVRPIGRRSLYLSRLIPVATVAAALAAIQVLLLALVRLLSYVVTGGADVVSWNGQATTDGALVILMLTPTAIMAAIMAAVLFTSLFGFVSLLSSRYHVYLNIGIFLAWELPFGATLIGTIGYFTVLHHAISTVFWLDPEQSRMGLVHPVLALVWMAGAAALWIYLGLRRVAKQDFNVTSAST